MISPAIFASPPNQLHYSFKERNSMVTITTQHGEFTGDTETEVLKQSRAAARKAKKQEKIDTENRHYATVKARANVFGVLSRLVSGEAAPCGWRVYTAVHERCPNGVVSEDGSRTVYRFDHHHDGPNGCEYGKAELSLFRGGAMTDKLVGVLVQGCSGVQVVWIETSGEEQMFAIGVHNGVTEMVRMEHVPMERLNGKKTSELFAD